MDLAGGINQFWLMDGLKISADEQAQLPAQLIRKELPFSNSNIDVLKSIAGQSDVSDRLWGKTGSGIFPDGERLGWFVGSLEKDGKSCAFAANVKGARGATVTR